MTETPSPRTLSNLWYGGLTEGDYQNTPDDFRKFLDNDVLSRVSAAERSKILGELGQWIPEQATTIRRLGLEDETKERGGRKDGTPQEPSSSTEMAAAPRGAKGMRFALFEDERLGLVHGNSIRDLTAVVGNRSMEGPGTAMLRLIQRWNDIQPRLDLETLSSLPEMALGDVRLGPPIPMPGKIVAAPINYLDHKEEMKVKGSVDRLGVFLKASSSVIGPGGTIELPYNDRRTDQEGELAVVVGKTTRNVRAADALDYVFGYTCLLDISVRGQEDRSTRKSFDTFTPIGPWIATKDEVGDPGQLELRCWVNQELRQETNTRNLIYSVPKLIEYVSSVMTLHAGDVVSTGTPAGVGPLADGDRVVVEIERVGRLEVGVSGERAVSSLT